MATEIKAPTFPESVAGGSVAAWHKKPGDSVERDELIVEIETDKVVLEVVAPEAGTLSGVLVEEGDTVEAGQVTTARPSPKMTTPVPETRETRRRPAAARLMPSLPLTVRSMK